MGNVAFADMQKLVEGLGFRLARVRGSHHIFVHPRIDELLNLQKVDGEAKPYQLRQFLRLVERYDLLLGGGMSDYHINIFSSDDDAGYIADIPELEACSAFGRTPEEALAALKRAKSVWLEAARAEGKPIPPPRYRPVIYQTAG